MLSTPTPEFAAKLWAPMRASQCSESITSKLTQQRRRVEKKKTTVSVGLSPLRLQLPVFLPSCENNTKYTMSHR